MAKSLYLALPALTQFLWLGGSAAGRCEAPSTRQGHQLSADPFAELLSERWRMDIAPPVKASSRMRRLWHPRHTRPNGRQAELKGFVCVGRGMTSGGPAEGAHTDQTPHAQPLVVCYGVDGCLLLRTKRPTHTWSCLVLGQESCRDHNLSFPPLDACETTSTPPSDVLPTWAFAHRTMW